MRGDKRRGGAVSKRPQGANSGRGRSAAAHNGKKRYHNASRDDRNRGIVSDAESESDSAPEEEGLRGQKGWNESAEDDFFSDEEDNRSNMKNGAQKEATTKKKSKHAPKETRINHRPVSVVRDIPGLVVRNRDGDGGSGLFGNRDVRFDTALGKSVDYETVRKQYAFLDEYREREIAEMEKILKDRKMLSRMDDNEIEEMRYKLQSTRSKLEALKKKDREKEALREYLREHKNDKNGKFLTRAEKRKVLLVDRFEHMSSKQKNKAIERKRKRKLGKEMRAMEFSGARG